MPKSYGQFCGLARAAEVVGERWTLLILRDLSVGPARFTELKSGLPGIAASMLSSRLQDLQDHGLVVKSDDSGREVYALTTEALDVLPALRALSLWGASSMRTPRDGEVVTDRSLAAMLDSARTDRLVEPFTVQVEAGPSVAHAEVRRTGLVSGPGAAERPDVVLSGTGLRDLLAHPEERDALLASQRLQIRGDRTLLPRFTEAFAVPLNPAAE